MQREEDISNALVDGRVQVLLTRDGRGVAQIGTPASRSPGAQDLGGGRVVELGGLAKGLNLARRVLKGRVIGGFAAGPVEGEVAEEEALQVADLAVLRQEDRSRGLCHCVVYGWEYGLLWAALGERTGHEQPELTQCPMRQWRDLLAALRWIGDIVSGYYITYLGRY